MSEQIRKYLKGEMSCEEKKEFLREINTNEVLKKHFTESLNQQALLNLAKQLENREEGKLKLQHFMRERRRKSVKTISLQFMKYAAVAFILSALSSLVTFYWTKKEQAVTVVTRNTLHTPAGQRAKLTLQDGTTVWLNANSTLTYPSQFIGNERRVQIQGEAFFHVAKDASKPFIVTSGKVEMEVLGTQFNVKHYPQEEQLQTSLLEGAVRVYCPESDAQGVILKPHQQVMVTDKEMVVSDFCSEDPFLWRNGIYAFNNEPLKNILQKLELYYDVEIHVTHPSILNGSYTGKFRQRDSLDDIFRILQQISWFKVEKSEDNRIIILKK